MINRSAILALLFSACTAACCCAAGPISATGESWAVASVHPLATDAAAEVFREGGNAVDAAVCAALTLSVVDNHNSGIGGGCLILVRSPAGEFLAIDGRETAPARAHQDMFLRDGVADTSLSQVGPLASATPGALAAYAALLHDAGGKSLARLLRPGMEHARNGFPIDSNYAKRLAASAKKIARDPGASAQLLKQDGEPYVEGETLRQPDLADTYAGIATGGTDWFYRGPLAKRIGSWMADNGGVLSAEDFAAYEPKRREPIVTSYRGHTIVGFPPPSSGGAHVAQILGMLERFDMKEEFASDPNGAVHLVAEAMKLAFADRAHWLGDADFADVPRGLIDPEYIRSLSEKIERKRANQVATHGTPPSWRQDLFGRHTTHIAAADAQGWWVAITATVNTGFGSKVIVPGTGMILNNEMDDFAAAPGTPNAFGLLGSENNSVQPGKRPLSSMSPTIVLDREGQPLLAVGAAGGPKIITQVVLAILGVIDREMPLEDAVAQPRWHHQWRPDTLSFEETTPAERFKAAARKGHRVGMLSSGGITQAIMRTDRGGLLAVRDPRVPGKAAAK